MNDLSEELKQFKLEICDRAKEVDPKDHLDWYSLSIGYFMAKRIDIKQAIALATIARYTYKYWDE
jgi:hypothetical protein